MNGSLKFQKWRSAQRYRSPAERMAERQLSQPPGDDAVSPLRGRDRGEAELMAGVLRTLARKGRPTNA